MTTLFIADLHLTPEKPEAIKSFLHFLQTQAPTAEALYILGDLFEAWVGDDFIPPGVDFIVNSLAALTSSNVPVYVMHGNRDFLLGEGFAQQSGCELLPEYHIIDLYGTKTLLMHGDLLCTDDVEYMKFRQMVRNPQWQQDFLSKSVEERIAMAQEARKESRQVTQQLDNEIMDVNDATVIETMEKWGVQQLIHGHTHRPNTHQLSANGEAAKRIVLGDWYEQGSVLKCDMNGCELQSFAFA